MRESEKEREREREIEGEYSEKDKVGEKGAR
jgi:hypothetical protein